MTINRKKVADEQEFQEDTTHTNGVPVSNAFDFLFEGENKDYDEEYRDSI
jgi:hypothetical protein